MSAAHADRMARRAAVLHLISRGGIGTIFLIAGLAKIADPIRFFSTLLQFRLFPDVLVPILAVYLPWLEFLLGLSVLLGVLHRASALLLVGLNVLFALAILSLVARGIEVDCGCFGLLADLLHLPDSADLKTAIRDVIFAYLSFTVFREKRSVLSLENYLRKKP